MKWHQYYLPENPEYAPVCVLVDSHGWKRAILFQDDGVYYSFSPLGTYERPLQLHGTNKRKLRRLIERKVRSMNL